jgi:hypothetical protein
MNNMDKQLQKLEIDLKWWEAKLAKTRKAGLRGQRFAQVCHLQRKIASLKG